MAALTRIAFICLLMILPSAAHAAERIITLGGDVTEIVFALGAGEAVVATDDTGLYPPEAAAKPKVGYVRALAAEGVLSLDPDLILATEVAGPPPVVAQLRQVGVPFVSIPTPYTLGGIVDKTRMIGGALGLTGETEALAEALQAQINELTGAVAAMDGTPRVAFLLTAAGGSPMAAGTGTAAHAMLEIVRAENVFAGHRGYKAVSNEAAIAAAPEVIVIMEHMLEASGGLAGLAANPALSLTPAAQSGRIFAVDAGALLEFGPRTPSAALSFAGDLRDAASPAMDN